MMDTSQVLFYVISLWDLSYTISNMIIITER
jgi:hypothetical protein